MVTERRGEDNTSNNKLIPQSLVPLPNTIDKKIVKKAIEKICKVYRDFLDSESKGSFLRSNIVDVYESKKVEK